MLAGIDLRHPRQRIRRRARRQRRGQDHADASDPWPSPGATRRHPRPRRPGRARQSRRRLHAADPRRAGPRAPDRLGLRRERQRPAIAGACRCSTPLRRDVDWALERVAAHRPRPPPLAETVRRRTPTPPAGAGPVRPPPPAAPGRTADQPRPPSPDGVVELVPRPATGTEAHRSVQRPRAQPALGASTACSISATARPRSARSTR